MKLRQGMSWRGTFGLGLAVSVAIVCTAPTRAEAATSSVRVASQQAQARFVRTKADGASVRNFPDRHALVVREMKTGELLRVRDESVGFLEVEAFGGLPVWVYGEFLQPTGRGGLMRVTGSGVNMRPRPGSGVDNMPLSTKLQRNDEVVFIERQNPSKPLADDWVKVWSPQSARGWVLASETASESDSAAAQAKWSEPAHPELAKDPVTEAAAPRKDPKATTPTTAAQPQDTGAASGGSAPDASREAIVALANADKLFNDAVAVDAADLTEVVEAYELVLRTAPPGSNAYELALRRLGETKARAGIQDLQRQIESEKQRREEELARLAREEENQQLAETPLWGRFQARGWLEKEMSGGQPVYTLHWAGGAVGEAVCTTGRYNLDLFEGFEVGVMGTFVHQGVTDGADGWLELPQLDVYRIEVISGSGARGR